MTDQHTAAAARAVESTMSAVMLAISVASVSIVFIAAGVAWPQAASSLLRLYFATLALLYVTLRAWRHLGHVRRRPKEYTPFDGPVAVDEPPAAPRQLMRLTAELNAAADADIARRALVPRAVSRMLAAEVRSRLERHRGHDMLAVTRGARLEALLSPPTLRLVRSAAMVPEQDPHITVGELEPILEDVEKL